MDSLDKIALENILLLSNHKRDNKYLIDRYKLTLVEEKESYDSVFQIKDLEYPIVFSFTHFLRYVEKGCHTRISRINLLKYAESAITNLYDILKDNPDDGIEEILEDVDLYYSEVYVSQKQCSVCNMIKDTYNYYLDEFTDALRESNRYLYYKPYYAPVSDEEEDSENEEEQESPSSESGEKED